MEVLLGHLRSTSDERTSSGKSFAIDRHGNVSDGDRVEYPARPVVLKDPNSVPTR